MSKIGFLTDSCSDIPQELADKYGIEVVGFPINLDGVEYMERKDFTNDQFYQMMRDAQGVLMGGTEPRTDGQIAAW